MTTCKKVAPAEVWTAALLERGGGTANPKGCVEPGLCKRNCFIDDAFTGLLGEAPHSCSETMVVQTVLPAAVQQQVQLPEEQGEEQQDAPKQHICQGRLQRQAGLGWPLLLSDCSPPLVLSAGLAICALGKWLAPARMRDSNSKQQFSFVFKVKTTKAQQPLAVRRKYSGQGSRKLICLGLPQFQI